jgi:hypothetical protein
MKRLAPLLLLLVPALLVAQMVRDPEDITHQHRDLVVSKLILNSVLGGPKLAAAAQTTGRDYTIPDAGADADFVMTAGNQTIAGNKTFSGSTTLSGSVARAGQEYQASGPPKVGATAGWVVAGAANLSEATLPAEQTASTMVVPVQGLKIGWTITSFKCAAQIESAGGAVTFDADLRLLTNAAGDPTDASLGAITQVAVTADTAVASSKTLTTPEVLAATEWAYVLVTATTAASTDIRFLGCTVTVTEA